MRSPGFFALAERINKCLMIANDTKFNPAPRSVRPTCRKILPALFLKNAEGAEYVGRILHPAAAVFYSCGGEI